MYQIYVPPSDIHVVVITLNYWLLQQNLESRNNLEVSISVNWMSGLVVFAWAVFLFAFLKRKKNSQPKVYEDQMKDMD